MNTSLRRPLATTAVLAVAATALAACSSAEAEEPADAAEGLTPLSLTLSWVTQAEYAGFYVADKKGYYEEEGIDIEIRPGGPDVSPFQLLAAGQTDIALGGYGQQLAAVEAGADLVTIAPAFERGAGRLVYFADRPELADPANWAGTKVSLWGGWQATFAATASKYDVDLADIEISNQSFDMTNFCQEGVDLADAMVYNEWAQAIAGCGGRELALIDYNELGTAVMEQNLVVDGAWLEENPELVEGFLRASMRGWLDVRDDPQLGVDTTLELGPALPEKFQTWQMNEINKLIWPSSAGLFTVPEEEWDRNEDLLVQFEVIAGKPVREDVVDMSFRDKVAAELEAEGADLIGADFEPMVIDPYTYFQD